MCGVYVECGFYGVCSFDFLFLVYFGKCLCLLDDFEFIDLMDLLKGCKFIFEFFLYLCIINMSKIWFKKVGDIDYFFVNRLYLYINIIELVCI